MIAEDFGPVYTRARARARDREHSGPTVEGACAHRAKRPARARPAQSATGTIVGIAVNFLKP